MGPLSIAMTGATGFVGRFVVDQALADGHRVTAFVRKPPVPAFPPQVKVVVVGDLGPNTDWSGRLGGIDAIIYLASRVHVMEETAGDPLAEYRRINTAAPAAMARAAASAGVRRLVYVSSIKANGEETPAGGPPFDERSTPMPVDPYGISKLEAERQLAALAAELGFEFAAVRPPLVYGPGVGGNFARLIRLAVMGVPLPLGQVDNRRSMIAVQNLADLLVLAATHPAADGHVFLASDGQDLSTPALLRLIAQSLGQGARLLPVPCSLLTLAGKLTGRGAEVRRLTGSLQVDSSLARTLLGWTPRLSVEEGVRSAVAAHIGKPLPPRKGG